MRMRLRVRSESDGGGQRLGEPVNTFNQAPASGTLNRAKAVGVDARTFHASEGLRRPVVITRSHNGRAHFALALNLKVGVCG